MAPVTFMCYICLLRATSLLFSLCVRNGSCDFHGFHDLYMFAVTKKGIVLSAFKQLQQRQAKHAAVWLCRTKTDGATSSLCRATETGATKTIRHASSADRARNPGGSGFREEVARHNTPVAPSETVLQAVTKTVCHASGTPSCTKSRRFWFPRGGGATQHPCRANRTGATSSLKIVSASIRFYLPLAMYMVLACNKKTLFDQTRCLATTTIAKDPNKTLNVWIITVLRLFLCLGLFHWHLRCLAFSVISCFSQ